MAGGKKNGEQGATDGVVGSPQAKIWNEMRGGEATSLRKHKEGLF